MHEQILHGNGNRTCGLAYETCTVTATIDRTSCVQGKVLNCTSTCQTDQCLVVNHATCFASDFVRHVVDDEVRDGMTTTVEDTCISATDGSVVFGNLCHVKIGSDLNLGSGVVGCIVGGVDQLFGSVNDIVAVLVLLNETGLSLTAIVASTEFIPYMVGTVYGSFVAVRSAFADECTITVVFTVRVNLLVGAVQNGNNILAKVLVERDVALVAIQTIANLTACQLLGSGDNHTTGSLVESSAGIYVLDNGIALVTGNGVTAGLIYLDVTNHQHAFVNAACVTPTGNTATLGGYGTRNGSGKHNIAEGCTSFVTSVDTTMGTVAADFRNQVYIAGYILNE